MTTVVLAGCHPEPLGSYLKALAVLRLVSEQADATARGWWEQDCFHLESPLDAHGLANFFLTHYQPTPIIAPWNGGSGFYSKDRKIGIQALAKSCGDRFAQYRLAIEIAQRIPEVAQAKGASKAEEDKRRSSVLKACRNLLPDACVDWLDAAVGLSADGKRAFAPILGTGGNEGRLDYTNNFMEYVAGLLIEPDPRKPVLPLLKNALFGNDADGFEPSAVGQYDPGRAGGFNQGPGIETADFPSNPWNFVLTLEGAVAWAAGLYRRQGLAYRSFLCSPFTVRSSPVGYGSAGDQDKTAARAEIWTPLWWKPARYAEIKVLLREGRATLDSKPAATGMEFAEAACNLGVDRGIRQFVRYSLLKRRGDSYIALPAGRFPVGYRREADLVRELTPILEDVDYRFRDAPGSYQSPRRRLDEAIFQLLTTGGRPALLDVAAALGRLYKWILMSGKPFPVRSRVSVAWAAQLNDSTEARIALALAGISDRDVGGIQSNLDRSDHQFAWTGRDLPARLVSVLERRSLTAEQRAASRNPFASTRPAPVRDIAPFIEGSVDDELIEDLLFSFLLLERKDTGLAAVVDPQEVWPVYALLKHLFLSRAVTSGDGAVHLRADLNVLSLLARDDVRGAAEIAIRRLRIAGLSPLEVEYEGGIHAQRLAAALLIPVTYTNSLRKLVLKDLAAQ
jgi:CRISPR-associated protein Csx17